MSGSAAAGALHGEPTEADRAYFNEILRQFAKPPKYCAESLRTDKELLLRVVREHKDGWRLIKSAAPELRADRDLLLATVTGSLMGWRAMAFAAPKLRGDRELGLEAVRQNAAALELLAPALRQDRALHSEAMSAISKRIAAPEPVRAWDHGKPIGESLARPRNRAQAQSAEEWSQRLQQVEQEAEGGEFRVVPLAALWLESHNGLVLAQVGVWENGFVEAECKLASLAVAADEHPAEAMKRMLRTAMASLSPNISVAEKFEVSEEHHAKRGEHMLRAVFKGQTQESFSWGKVAKRVAPSEKTSTRSGSGNLTLGRRFGKGGASYTAPMAPDIFVLSEDVSAEKAEPGRIRWPADGPVDLYAWIPPWEFGWLRGSRTGHAVLQEWLDELSVPREGGARDGSQLPSLSSPRSPSRGASAGSQARVSPPLSGRKTSDASDGRSAKRDSPGSRQATPLALTLPSRFLSVTPEGRERRKAQGGASQAAQLRGWSLPRRGRGLHSMFVPGLHSVVSVM